MYRIFILCLSMIFVGFLAAAQAQEIGDIVWEDHFDDPVNH